MHWTMARAVPAAGLCVCVSMCVCVVQALLSQFNELVASEDPRNGNLLVGLIDAPYVAGEDAGELATWAA